MNLLEQSGKRTRRWIIDFRAFILRGNVVDLAVGIVIGAAFTGVITTFVKDVITPLIGIFGDFNFPSWTITIGKSNFMIGEFINSVLSFLIVALVVYFFVVRPVNTLVVRYKPKESAVPTTRPCPFCRNDVPVEASRCGHCTSQLPPPEEPSVLGEHHGLRQGLSDLKTSFEHRRPVHHKPEASGQAGKATPDAVQDKTDKQE